MAIHDKFALIEAAAERGDETAKDWLALISDTIRTAFDSSKILGLALDGADSCERVAEALAVWIKESAPRHFADITATRYTVSGLDYSAAGMERLRDQSESILLADPDADSTPESILAEWLADLDSCDRGDSFNYNAAEHAICEYVAGNRLAVEAALSDIRAAIRNDYERAKAAGELDEHGELGESYFDERPPLRLYLNDDYPESGE